MPRLLFEKAGNAVWMSHLDLMRLFQRAFKRAELPLTHTQGYNPRPSVSIALPLSVGVESQCELLDFDLQDCDLPNAVIREKLNAALVDGVKVLDVYSDGRKIRDIALLRCEISLEYDNGAPSGAADAILALFGTNEVIVPKRTKSGMQEQNIIPMISDIRIMRSTERSIVLEALICCQNPALNPAQISLAIEKYLPDCRPDFFKCRRIEIYDNRKAIFR